MKHPENEEILEMIQSITKKYYGLNLNNYSLMELEKLKDTLIFAIKLKQETGQYK